MRAPADTEPYDEFSMLPENAAEIGREWDRGLTGTRRDYDIGGGQRVSALVWGQGDPEVVYLHGGGQNAHTWDTVVLAGGRPCIAVDLPGHGRSDWRADGDYSPGRNAEAVAAMVERAAPSARAVVGMSLGGVTTIRMAAARPDLVRRAIIVDVTPQVNGPGRERTPEQRGTTALISGPPTYESFDSVVAATVALSPNRSEAAVRRGVRHNTWRREDGRWAWRYDLFREHEEEERDRADFSALWDDVSTIAAPTMVVQGGNSVFVRPADRVEFERRMPGVRWEVVAGAGHSVQSDQPLALAALVAEFVDPEGR